VRSLFGLHEFMACRVMLYEEKRDCGVGSREKSQNLIKLAKKRTVEDALSLDGFPQSLWKTCG